MLSSRFRLLLALLTLAMAPAVPYASAQEPQPLEGIDWGGFYLGAGASGGTVHGEGQNTVSFGTVNGVRFEGTPRLEDFISPQLIAGFATQHGRAVIGFEGEIDLGGPITIGPWDPATGLPLVEFPLPGPEPCQIINGEYPPGFCGEYGLLGRFDMLGRARMTLGVEVAPRLLVFGSAGLSVARGQVAGHWAIQSVGAEPFCCANFAFQTNEDAATELMIGGNLGVGGQVALTDNIAVRGEVIHDFFRYNSVDQPLHTSQELTVTNPSGIYTATQQLTLADFARLLQTSARVSLIVSF